MTDDETLLELMHLIGRGETGAADRLLRVTPALARAELVGSPAKPTPADYFVAECHLQLYAGDTALHVAAASYAPPIIDRLLEAGADVRARNRRGAEPLHAATVGGPGSTNWAPDRQAGVIAQLVAAGADPNAPAVGGVTPLHRAVRNRCSAAVRALLDVGADPDRPNNAGSTPLMLAGWTTGRGGSGSLDAKSEQAEIVRLLTHAATT